MKILESGRQIEASKMKNTEVCRGNGRANVDVSRNPSKNADRSYASQKNTPTSYPSSQASSSEGALKVAFFEDRIKNIITSALNEDTKGNVANSNAPSPFLRNENWPAKVAEASDSKTGIPDYTQVSPAKLALRRHLSQERIAPPAPPSGAQASPNFIGTRTIGDLVSGEIERTLEISNQSIINKVVPMCLGAGTQSNVNKNEFADSLIQKSLANSPASGKQDGYGGAGSHQFAKNSRSSVLYSTTNSQSVPYSGKYPTVHLPRTEMKPYHESYFTDMKPPTKEEPVEG